MRLSLEFVKYVWSLWLLVSKVNTNAQIYAQLT